VSVGDVRASGGPFAGATRDAYRRTLLELARADRRILCLDSDMGGLEETFAGLREQYVNLGIAEANMMSVAAGLAAAGKIPFANTMASFASTRAGEQVKIDIAGNDLPVKIVATHAGLSAGHFGPTHHALEDLAIMRALPNMTVVVPADAVETVLAVRALAERPGPAYVRLGRQPTPRVYGEPYRFRVGEAVVLRDGDDVTIAACGAYPVLMALEAGARLQADGVRARVLNVHTLKPLDAQAMVRAAEETRGIVTVEEHGRCGGLGSAVAEVSAEHAPCRVRRIAVADEARELVGDQRALLEAAGVTPERIVEACRSLLPASWPRGRRPPVGLPLVSAAP
jgi:transketolase